MISKFVREQKRYSIEELKEIFGSDIKGSAVDDASNLTEIIKKLKGYGILKTVEKNTEQSKMTFLDEEDVEVVSEEDNQNNRYYVFTFVGIIIVKGRIIKCVPKYMNSLDGITDNNPSDKIVLDFKQVIKVLKSGKNKKEVVNIYNDCGTDTSFNRLSVLVYLLDDYYENGLYTKTEDILETNGMGEINWDRTINDTYPIIYDNRPYYAELQTKRKVSDEDNFFKRLHEIIITECSKELNEAGLLDILGINDIELTEESLPDIGETEYILYRLDKELNVQFNTRKQLLLNAIKAYIKNSAKLYDTNTFSLFGTNSFNLVWENVCKYVFDDKLDLKIKNCGINNVIIPQNANYKKDSKLKDVIEKPKWCEFTKESSVESVAICTADKTLIPDLITIKKTEDELTFIIFDAKYYNLEFSGNVLSGQPGIGDITKQYLYQLAYKDFIKANGIKKVKNCFLMPSEENGKDGVVKKGYVCLDMLDALGLEYIEYRVLSARKLYELYLNNQKFEVDLFK